MWQDRAQVRLAGQAQEMVMGWASQVMGWVGQVMGLAVQLVVMGWAGMLVMG
jgi:hypothetical protein